MQLHLSPDDPRPLYEQIASEIARLVDEGELRTGDRLPSGRDLASSLAVNLETVQRAYRSLAGRGVVASRVGRGTTVIGSPHGHDPALLDTIAAAIGMAREAKLGRDEFIEIIHSRWRDQ